jgi:hypothetical protein
VKTPRTGSASFHVDGLRFDATQDIHDESKPNILAEMGQAARRAAGSRSIILVAENEPQRTELLRPVEEGGYGFDALWNDDYHHSAMVALTGKSDAYYRDYRGTPQELVSGAKYGYLYQGQWYRWQKKRRGTSTLGLPAPRWSISSKITTRWPTRPVVSVSMSRGLYLQSHDGSDPAHARHSHALSGTGICFLQPLSLFADHKTGTGRKGP